MLNSLRVLKKKLKGENEGDSWQQWISVGACDKKVYDSNTISASVPQTGKVG